MAVGDRITGERTTGFMRRINALENLLDYSVEDSHTDSDIADTMVGDGIDSIYAHYYDGADSTMQKFDYNFDNQTQIIDAGDSAGELKDVCSFNDPNCFGCNGINLWTCDNFHGTVAGDKDTRIQKFNLDGTYVTGNTIEATDIANYSVYREIGVFSDGTIVTYRSDFTTLHSPDTGRLLTYNSTAGNEDEIFNFRIGDVTTGNITSITHLTILPDDQFIVSLAIAGQRSECRFYEFDGTLNKTLYFPVNPLGYNGLGKTFELITPTKFYTSLSTRGVFSIDGQHHPQITVGVFPGDVFVNDAGHIFVISPTDLQRLECQDTQTTWYRYPTPATDTGKVSLGTPNFGFSIPATDALDGFRPHYFELRDMRTAIESIASNYLSSITEGTTTGVSANKLWDSTQNFTETVAVGDTVKNQTDGTQTTVSVVDSNTQLTLNADIMGSGDDYTIQGTVYTTGAGDKNIFRLAIDQDQDDWTTATIDHGDRIREEFYDEIDTVLTYLEASQID